MILGNGILLCQNKFWTIKAAVATVSGDNHYVKLVNYLLQSPDVTLGLSKKAIVVRYI